MAEVFFQTGDRVRIVNYGHLVWSRDFLGAENLYGTYDNGYWYDIRPDYIGKETVIIKKSEDSNSYSTELFSWANSSQLELITKKEQ